ncbi:hypothetical protein PsorP6_005497 [Peronosclerospora sorghi]|uniref:Uncharacterized protein n=1 Tax=Peronosclerospora sorghi TaxID=230839 RepID=A0ACC0W200_9STRA|nr:hypothetical protein PsorP6_005497 [Peronosclerospora sorghi]
MQQLMERVRAFKEAHEERRLTEEDDGEVTIQSLQELERETASRRRQLILEERKGPEDKNGTMEAMVLYSMGPNTEVAQMPANHDTLLPRGKRPSSCLRFDVVEIIFAYALVLRAFTGDYDQDVSGAACIFLDLCRVSCVDERYESIPHVCLACLVKHASEGPSANVRAIQDTG